MNLTESKLKQEKLERESGWLNTLYGAIPTLKKRHYRIIKGTSVGGDAPKELLRIYEYKKGVKQIKKPHSWPIYIVKTGHKWYPFESITEHLLNRLGSVFGLEMAESKLYFINGQIRFCSKLFRHEKNQVLEHGAELYSGFLDDKDFVEQVEKQSMARHFFTLSFTMQTLKNIYPYQAEDIFLELVKLLVFDAIIGNNDRHFYNWGVIKHLNDNHQPKFSPIYDTARALFWNRSEGQIKQIHQDSFRKEKVMQKYLLNSKPKIGIENQSNCNHIDMIKFLNGKQFEGTHEVVRSMVNMRNSKLAIELLNDEFRSLFSTERLDLISELINFRMKKLIEEL